MNHITRWLRGYRYTQLRNGDRVLVRRRPKPIVWTHESTIMLGATYVPVTNYTITVEPIPERRDLGVILDDLIRVLEQP